MRHRKKLIHLGRKVGHRRLMLANMACSLIEHKSINTTTTKAKTLQRYIEPIITRSKTDTIHNRRLAFKFLRNKKAVTELFNEVSTKVGDRPGGYTRVIKLGNRLGDNAEMAMIELTDYNDLYKLDKPTRSSRTRRSKKSTEPKTTAKETPQEFPEPEDSQTDIENDNSSKSLEPKDEVQRENRKKSNPESPE